MRLSEFNENNLSDKEIEHIVFSDIEDNMLSTEYGIVFGNYQLQKYRVEKAADLYKQGRIKKLILLGGNGGISNENNDNRSEAELMETLAIEFGVKKEDIYLEDKSNNSIENCLNVVDLLNSLVGINNIEGLTLITSQFHLKRCLAVFKKYLKKDVKYTLVSVLDGFSDRDNWFLSDESWNTGRSLVTFEARALVKYAKEEKIFDLNVTEFKNIKQL